MDVGSHCGEARTFTTVHRRGYSGRHNVSWVMGFFQHLGGLVSGAIQRSCDTLALVVVDFCGGPITVPSCLSDGFVQFVGPPGEGTVA